MRSKQRKRRSQVKRSAAAGPPDRARTASRIVDRPAAPGDQAHAGQTDIAARRVLVVDDDAFSRSVLIELLQSFGVRQVAGAASGREALAALHASSPVDIVVCDLDMPGMDGIELLRLIAERKLARGVIIVSGREPDILRGASAMVGAHSFPLLGELAKPIDAERLREAFARTLPSKPAQTDEADLIERPQLLNALKRREFYPVFQPKVRLATRQVQGVEALARWRRPDGQAIAPNAFLPALTRESLLTPLADLMLEESCRALSAWQRRGLTLGAAINVSMSTLADLSVADRFERRVRHHGLDPSRITLEVTETEIMACPARVLNVLSRLRLKGFQLSIDDYGTGYSSLQHLNMLPFTELKIDQNFVRNSGASPRLRNILDSSIELAHRLGIPAVAEGVETAAEWSFLASHFCDQAQGYFIARPLPEKELPQWKARWSAA